MNRVLLEAARGPLAVTVRRVDLLLPAAITVLAVVAVVVAWHLAAPRHEPSLAEAKPDDRVTMYDRLGPATIRAAVDQFYHRALHDPRLAPYFAGVDMGRLRRHQALFIGQVLGGPVHFQMHQLEAMHRRLHVSVDAYWIAVAHLMAVLSGMRAPREVLERISGALIELEPLVVERAPSPS